MKIGISKMGVGQKGSCVNSSCCFGQNRRISSWAKWTLWKAVRLGPRRASRWVTCIWMPATERASVETVSRRRRNSQPRKDGSCGQVSKETVAEFPLPLPSPQNTLKIWVLKKEGVGMDISEPGHILSHLRFCGQDRSSGMFCVRAGEREKRFNRSLRSKSESGLDF